MQRSVRTASVEFAGALRPLSALPVGDTALVAALKAEGLIRRRLLDLGFVPGTQVRAIRRSPFGDPTAYKVMGAAVALRAEEAGKVLVR